MVYRFSMHFQSIPTMMYLTVTSVPPYTIEYAIPLSEDIQAIFSRLPVVTIYTLKPILSTICGGNNKQTHNYIVSIFSFTKPKMLIEVAALEIIQDHSVYYKIR